MIFSQRYFCTVEMTRAYKGNVGRIEVLAGETLALNSLRRLAKEGRVKRIVLLSNTACGALDLQRIFRSDEARQRTRVPLRTKGGQAKAKRAKALGAGAFASRAARGI